MTTAEIVVSIAATCAVTGFLYLIYQIIKEERRYLKKIRGIEKRSFEDLEYLVESSYYKRKLFLIIEIPTSLVDQILMKTVYWGNIVYDTGHSFVTFTDKGINIVNLGGDIYPDIIGKRFVTGIRMTEDGGLQIQMILTGKAELKYTLDCLKETLFIDMKYVKVTVRNGSYYYDDDSKQS